MRTLALGLTASLAASAVSAAPPVPRPNVVYPWAPDALYAVAAAPGRVTDLALQPGEQLVGAGPVAAGDTARWVIGDTESGAGSARQVHVLLKPAEPGLATNLVIMTDRRTYHLELRASSAGYMPSVSWRYPEGALIAIRGGPSVMATKAAEAPATPPRDPVADLDFAYRLEGEAPWRPLRVFDDGRRTFIDFPPAVAAGEMPPLFVLSSDGKAAQLVNYRVQGLRMIVDRIFDRAELRLGAGHDLRQVRIVREGVVR